MGQDITIIFVADRVSPAVLVEAAQQAFREDPPEYLVLLYGQSGPRCMQELFTEFTTVSPWADCEASPAPLAAVLSARFGRAVAFTTADHAAVGSWQGFQDGRAGPVIWLDEDYTRAGINGVQAVYGVELLPTDEELLFTESFLDYHSAICVFGSGVLRPGNILGPGQIQAILEYDFEGVDLECMLLDT